ncbi:MAG: cyclic nucleotide-binding domain-containing protein [Cyclobacteriaceae bacterium]|nr:cyclic nucleotide-binding domain-containing protein [Cyclobacteriaceae bacterium]
MKNPFKKTYTENELEQFDFLRNFELFKNLTEKELMIFLPHMHYRSYVKDEVVFFRNDPSHALYLIKKGIVNMTLDVNEKFEDLGEVRMHEVLGENCLIEGTKRPMNAVVTSETAFFYVIPRDNIMRIFDSRPEVKMKMMESFAKTNEYYLKQVFKCYRSSFGLFSLSEIFKN